MRVFDGTLASIGPSITEASIEILKIKEEIESLHQAFDRLGLPEYDGDGLLTLGKRFELIYKDPEWKKVK